MWDWIRQLQHLRQQGIPFVITTVTRVTGSTPRETGAKMIIASNGERYGTIGGGHLEQLVIEEAIQQLQNASAQILRYPLGAKTGQCCGGIVEILFEPIC